MKKTMLILATTFSLFGVVAGANAFDVNAGPIWDNNDAKGKCPAICEHYGGWNGNWTTTAVGKMSVCGCNEGPSSSSPNDANAGPIWDNDDAKGKCPAACEHYGGWNGNWTTTVEGKMSVCGCNENVQ